MVSPEKFGVNSCHRDQRVPVLDDLSEPHPASPPSIEGADPRLTFFGVTESLMLPAIGETEIFPIA